MLKKLISLLLTSAILLAEIPLTLNYQGYLLELDGSYVNGDKNITFLLYDSFIDGDILWRSDRNITINNGIYSVVLGEVKPLDLAFDKPYWFTLVINDGNESEELSPRQQLSSSAYSLDSINLKKVLISSIETNATKFSSDLTTAQTDLVLKIETNLTELNSNISTLQTKL